MLEAGPLEPPPLELPTAGGAGEQGPGAPGADGGLGREGGTVTSGRDRVPGDHELGWGIRRPGRSTRDANGLGRTGQVPCTVPAPAHRIGRPCSRCHHSPVMRTPAAPRSETEHFRNQTLIKRL